MPARRSVRRKNTLLCRIFGDRIRALRKTKGWTLEELAHHAGMHVTYLSGLERGRRNPTLSVISLLALALGIPFSELFAGIRSVRSK